MTLPSWIPQINWQRSRTSWSLFGTSSIIDRVADKGVVLGNLMIVNNTRGISSLGALTQVTDANMRRSPRGAASVRIIMMKGTHPAAVALGTARTNLGKISYSRTWNPRILGIKNLSRRTKVSRSSSLWGLKSLTTIYTQHRYSHFKRRILGLPSFTMLASSARQISWLKLNDSKVQDFFLSNLKFNQSLERHLCMS